MPEDAGVVADSPQPDVTAPSADAGQVQEPAPQQAPASPSQPEPQPEEQRVPLTRLQEVIRERDLERQRSQQLLELAQRVQPQPSVAPQADPWEGLVNHPDPQTALFYQNQQRLFQYEAARKAEEKVRLIMELTDTFRKELASIKVERFQEKNQEIKPGSEDYNRIAELVGQGWDLETATEKVMYKRLKEENQALRAKQSSVGSKVAANQTGPTSGMPATTGLPGRPGDWRENVRQAARKGGSLADIVNAAGASRAP